MVNRIFCLLGWHRWFIDQQKARAKCIHCGTELYA